MFRLHSVLTISGLSVTVLEDRASGVLLAHAEELGRLVAKTESEDELMDAILAGLGEADRERAV